MLDINAGAFCRLTGDLAQAKTYLETSWKTAKDSTFLLGLAAALDNLGLLAIDEQNWVAAKQYLEEALETWQLINSKFGEIRATLYLAEYEYAQGSFAKAEQILTDVLNLLNGECKQYTLLKDQAEILARSLP